jgi:hypothetical protein
MVVKPNYRKKVMNDIDMAVHSMWAVLYFELAWLLVGATTAWLLPRSLRRAQSGISRNATKTAHLLMGGIWLLVGLGWGIWIFVAALPSDFWTVLAPVGVGLLVALVLQTGLSIQASISRFDGRTKSNGRNG